jgi:hypothetical protein
MQIIERKDYRDYRKMYWPYGSMYSTRSMLLVAAADSENMPGFSDS